MKFAKALLLLACLSFFTGKVNSAPVTADTAVTAVKGWLLADPTPLKERFGAKIQNVDTYKDKDGLALYHVVNLKPSGFIIVAADDEVEPIIAFVAHGHYDPSTNNPLGALVGRDLSTRVAWVRGTGYKPAFTGSKVHDKWQKLIGAGGSGGGGVQPAGVGSGSIDDLRVSPFIQTLWSQNTNHSGQALYNYFTPPYGTGVSTNYFCGCVATALAQLMYYYQYPTVRVGTAVFPVSVDGVATSLSLRGGDGYGGPYDWADMPLDPNGNGTAIQYQAIGSLCYDAGVAVNMAYTASSSSAYMVNARTALATTFKYKNAILCDGASINVGFNLVNMINPNLDAGFPVLLGFNQPAEGHCAVIDGYGYDLGTLYHHMNMGWDDPADDVWYALPDIATFDNGLYENIEDCLYNIFTNSTGEIISGRVLDSTATPIAGATVTASRVGGGVYSTTTGANGIYALAGVPSSSTYIITATNSGYFSATSNYNTTLSAFDSTNAGNVWGANFTLQVASGPPVITTQPANQSVIVGQNAIFGVVAAGQLPLAYQWQTQPSGSPDWVNLSDGAGYSGSATANLTVIDPPVANNGEPFRCIVTNSLDSATSSTAILSVSVVPYLTISTLAGTPGVIGSTDGMNGTVEFDDPLGIAVDANTNVYVADLDNQVIRQLYLSGTNWVSTTIAGETGVTGSSDGAGTNALFDGPHGIAVDSSGNVYVSDTGNDTIRRLTYGGGVWTVNTIAGLAGAIGSTNGINNGNRFRFPMGLAVDSSGNVYVADEGNSQIRELSPSGGNWVGSTVAGLVGISGSMDGTSANATFSSPSGIAVDASGNLYVADTKNNTIRELVFNGNDWTVTTIAGEPNQTGSSDGTGSAALFNNPTGIAVDPSGDLYVVDSGNDTIRRMTVNGTNWTVFTSAGVAGDTGTADGTGAAVRFKGPNSIAIDAYTNVYISDSLNGTIRGTPLFVTVTPAVLQLSKSINGNPAFMLTWTAVVGHNYEVQYKTNMNAVVWNNLTTLTASNWTGMTSIPIGSDPQRFYRVIQLH